MPRDIAARLAQALNVRSQTAISQIDRALSDYARLVPKAAATPIEGSITESQITDLGNYADKDVAETVNAGWTFARFLRLTGVAADTITADQDDYNPTGLANATRLEVEPSGGNFSLTGIAGGVDGRILFVQNVSTSRVLVLTNEDAASVAANRIVHANGVNESLPSGGAAILIYSGTLSRWQVAADAL